MINRLCKQIVATLAAAAILMTGCASPTAVPSDTDPVGGRMILTDTRSDDSLNAMNPENPPIDSDPDLPVYAAVEDADEADLETGGEPDPGQQPADISPIASKSKTKDGEIRAVWISYLDLAPILTGKTEKQFRAGIETAFDNVKNYGLNTLIVQVRPFADALYDSDYFPWSYLITGTEGKKPAFDPMKVMLEEAKKRGLRFEAWINPYRVRAAGNTKAMSADNQAKTWLENGDDSVIRYDGVVSYNPASKKAQDLIINGVREIIQKYDVDGIHIDDYFYPHTSGAFDKASYTAYKNAGGKMSLADWRRSNVSELIKKMYKAIKEEDSSVVFGISPQSSIDNNYNYQYLDVYEITSKPGYCDYICPQVYFGFTNDAQPFAETVDVWDGLIKNGIDLYVGIAVYKVGLADSWAGSGSKEWQQNDDLLARMVEHSRGMEHYGGFALYRYDSLFKPAGEVKSHVDKEMKNLRKIMS